MRRMEVIVFVAGLSTALFGCQKQPTVENPSNYVARQMKKLMPTPPKELVAMAYDPDDADRRRMGIEGLSQHDWGLKEPYLQWYALQLREDEDASVRGVAARALGKAGDVTYLPDLAAALEKDPVAAVRWDAAVALEQVIGPEALRPLQAAALTDSSQDVRAAAIRTLRNYPRQEVMQTLIGCLNDPAFGVRYQAHESLVAMSGRDLGYDAAAWAAETGIELQAAPYGARKRPWWDWMGVTDRDRRPAAANEGK